MLPPDLQNDFPHIIRLYHHSNCSAEKFSGSGILLGSGHILTCAHVAEALAANSNKWFALQTNGAMFKVIQGPSSSEEDRERNLTLVDLVVFEIKPLTA